MLFFLLALLQGDILRRRRREKEAKDADGYHFESLQLLLLLMLMLAMGGTHLSPSIHPSTPFSLSLSPFSIALRLLSLAFSFMYWNMSAGETDSYVGCPGCSFRLCNDARC